MRCQAGRFSTGPVVTWGSDHRQHEGACVWVQIKTATLEEPAQRCSSGKASHKGAVLAEAWGRPASASAAPTRQMCLRHEPEGCNFLLFNRYLSDDHGFSPLHWACREGRSGVVDMLIMRGARINVMNRGDDTPLHLAASHGHRDILAKVNKPMQPRLLLRGF